MKYEVSEQDGRCVLHLRDQLVFADRESFDAVLPRLLEGNRPIVVDFQGLEYMDSAGLGMLLTLRDKAERVNAPVILRHAEGEVAELLQLACFDTLFTIE